MLVRVLMLAGMSRNLWNGDDDTAIVAVSGVVLSLTMLSACSTLFRPNDARFFSIWSSSSLRSIMRRIVGLSDSGALKSSSAVLIMV